MIHGLVEIELMDSTNSLHNQLFSGELNQGKHTLRFKNAVLNRGAGIYFLKISTPGESSVLRLIKTNG